MMNTRQKLQMTSLILISICFIFNLMVTSLFVMNVKQNMDKAQGPYCTTCTELCGVWKCLTVTTGEAMKKMEVEALFPFIVATSIVNLVLGVVVMCLMIFGLCQDKKERMNTRDQVENVFID